MVRRQYPLTDKFHTLPPAISGLLFYFDLMVIMPQDTKLLETILVA